MKKIIRKIAGIFFVLVIGIVGLNSCYYIGLGHPKSYTLTIYYGNLSSYTKTIKYEKNEYVYTDDFDLPSELSANYYLLGWYTDVDYSNSFTDGCKMSSDLSIYAKLGSYSTISEFTFCKNVDEKDLTNYFKAKGTYISIDDSMNYDMILAYSYQSKGYGDGFYRIKSEKIWSLMNRTREVLYFPKIGAIIINFSITSKSAIGTLNYADEYKGSVEFKIGQKLDEAIYTGTYTYSCIDSRTYTYKAQYTAQFVFSPSKVNPDTLRLGNFSTCTYTGEITDAMDYFAAQKHFDKKDSAEKCYEKLNACLNHLDDLLGDINLSYKSVEK